MLIFLSLLFFKIIMIFQWIVKVGRNWRKQQLFSFFRRVALGLQVVLSRHKVDLHKVSLFLNILNSRPFGYLDGCSFWILCFDYLFFKLSISLFYLSCLIWLFFVFKTTGCKEASKSIVSWLLGSHKQPFFIFFIFGCIFFLK